MIYKLTTQKGDLDKFIGLIENAVELEPKKHRQARFYQLSSLIYYGIKDLGIALKEIDKSIELNPQNYSFALTKIYILTEKEDDDEVFKYIDKVINLFPEKKARFLIIKSFIYHHKGEKIASTTGNKEKASDYYLESLKILDEVLEKNPDHPIALNNRIISLASLDRQDEAIKAGQKLITLHPEVGNYFDSFAEVLMQFGKYQEAIEHFTRAIEIDPHGFYVYLSYNKMAICYKELGDYERALETAEKSKEIANKIFPDEKAKYNYNIDVLIEEIKALLENKKVN
jgi:tetratricopeptide (TPR) repeat protein